MRYARTILLFPTGPWVASVYWTLAHEIAFYALIFFLLLAGKVRHLPNLLGILGVASTSLWILILVNQSYPLGPIADTVLMLCLHVPATFVLSFGCYFALGGFLYLCTSGQCTPWRLMMIAVCGGGALLRIVGRTARMSETMHVPLDPTVPATVFAVAVLLMTASLIWHEPIRSRLGRHAAKVREIGLATYPFYLLHAPLGAAILFGLRRLGVGQALALAVAIAASVTASFLVSRFFERPLQSGLRHALTQTAPALGAQPASVRGRHA
jgi:peptidoglycan/LPS O-acetylase OafA/YrhL